MNAKVAKVKSAGTDALAVVAGLIAGKFVMDFAQGKMPNVAVPALGLLGLVPHLTDVGGELGEKVGCGLLAAGLIQAGKNFTAGKTGLLASVNSALPALSGFGGYAGLAGLNENPDYQALAALPASDPVFADDKTLLFN